MELNSLWVAGLGPHNTYMWKTDLFINYSNRPPFQDRFSLTAYSNTPLWSSHFPSWGETMLSLAVSLALDQSNSYPLRQPNWIDFFKDKSQGTCNSYISLLDTHGFSFWMFLSRMSIEHLFMWLWRFFYQTSYSFQGVCSYGLEPTFDLCLLLLA